MELYSCKLHCRWEDSLWLGVWRAGCQPGCWRCLSEIFWRIIACSIWWTPMQLSQTRHDSSHRINHSSGNKLRKEGRCTHHWGHDNCCIVLWRKSCCYKQNEHGQNGALVCMADNSMKLVNWYKKSFQKYNNSPMGKEFPNMAHIQFLVSISMLIYAWVVQ